jgi:hypothetical protein
MSTNALPQRRLALPLTVVGLAAYWVGIVALVHVLEPEFNPIRVPLSGYVLGMHGAWMATSFFAAGAIWLLLALGLRTTLPSTWWTKAGALLFLFAAFGNLTLGIFPTDSLSVAPPTTLHGLIHLRATTATFNAIALGCTLFSGAFRSSTHWKPIWTATMALSLLLFVLLYGWVFFLLGSGRDGLLERLVVVPMALWLILVVRQWIRWYVDVPRAPGRAS